MSHEQAELMVQRGTLEASRSAEKEAVNEAGVDRHNVKRASKCECKFTFCTPTCT